MIVWVTLAMLVVCAVWGWRSGVVRRLIELVGVVAAVVASARFAAGVAPWLGEHTAMSDTAALLAAYVLVFVAALIVVRLVARTVAAVVHWTPLGWIDRIGGAVCGVLIGALLISVGLIAVSQAPGGQSVHDTYMDHAVGQFIYQAAPMLYHGVRQIFGGQMDELWRRVVDVGGTIVDDGRQAAGGAS